MIDSIFLELATNKEQQVWIVEVVEEGRTEIAVHVGAVGGVVLGLGEHFEESFLNSDPRHHLLQSCR